MDLLKRQFQRLFGQPAARSSSRRLFAAGLAAVVFAALVWCASYARGPKMEPVLDQAFSSEDISRIADSLASSGIRYSVTGGRILVPADRKFEVLASLTYSHVLPSGTSSRVDQLAKALNNPFNSDSTNEKLFNHGKEVMLSQIIGNFPNVAQADVMIAPVSTAQGRSGVQSPSAIIVLKMHNGGAATQQLVEAAADVLQGAQSGLMRSQIKVVVDGVRQPLRDPDLNDHIDNGAKQHHWKTWLYESRVVRSDLSDVNMEISA